MHYRAHTYSAHSVFKLFLWGARKSTPDALAACATSVSQCSTQYKTKEGQKLKIINQQSQKSLSYLTWERGGLYSNACWEEEGLEPIEVLTLV